MVQPDTHPEPSPVKKGKRIVLTTFGSLGDFHPYVAIALGLKARGHEAVLATGECYRAKVEALGLGFRAVRPDSAVVTDPIAMRRFMDSRWGTVRVLRDYIVPAITETYEDTLAVVPHAHDQPENARRLVRLGIARTVSCGSYRSDRVAAELEQLLGDSAYSERASEVGEEIRREDGVKAASDALEALLNSCAHS
jgi:UDP:flavonoid glycosyltransferase YjiC (YdhE family)